MARAPLQIARPLNIGAPAGSPPLIGGGPISAALMNPQPMTPQGPGMAPPQFSRQFPGPGSDPLANAPQLPAAGPSAMPMSAPAQGGVGGRVGNFLGSDAALGLAAGILEGGTTGQALGRGFGYALAAKQAANKPTATTNDIQNFVFAKENGFPGSFTEFMTLTRKAGAMNIDNRTTGPLEKGYMYEWDESGNPVRMTPIPGGPADNSEKIAASQDTAAKSADIVLGAIDDAETIFEANPEWTTGLGGSIALKLPGSPAVDLQAAIEPIEASIAFDRLQQMRDESPSGGALGQVSERELALLSATIASLKQSQSSDAFRRNLGKVKTVYRAIAKKFAAYPNASAYGFAPPEFYDEQEGGQGWQDMGDGVRVRELP